MDQARKELIKKLKALGKRSEPKATSILESIIAKISRGYKASLTLEELQLLASVNMFTTLDAQGELISYQKIMSDVFTKSVVLNGGTRSGVANLTPLFLENTMKYITKLGDTFKLQTGMIIDDGIKKGLMPEEITKNVKAYLNNEKWQARRIVRTETMRAVNTAAHIQAVQDGMKYYVIDSRAEACKYCLKTGALGPFPITDKTRMPPLHSNCACIAVYYDSLEDAQNDKDYIDTQIDKARASIEKKGIEIADDGTSQNTNKLKPEQRIWN